VWIGGRGCLFEGRIPWCAVLDSLMWGLCCTGEERVRGFVCWREDNARLVFFSSFVRAWEPFVGGYQAAISIALAVVPVLGPWLH
jgi:hypothetical protein